MKPFSEDKIFELHQPSGSFYSTSTSVSIGEKPGTFSGDLKTKDQVKISFGVKNPVKMLAKSSSIYYFDKSAGQWRLPPNSVTDHVGPFDKFCVNTLWGVPSGTTGLLGTQGTLISEDYKGFDPYGRSVMSGSLNMHRQVEYPFFNQSADFIGSPNKSRISEALEQLNGDYPKSVQRSSTYDASEDQTFSIEIDRPFLIEKAVIEVPFALGESWFQDRTMTTLSTVTGAFSTEANPIPATTFIDKGGPGITISLFSQKGYGPNKIRDLILTGVLTHTRDNKRLTHVPSGSTNPYGLLMWMSGMETSVSAKVSPSNQNTFTGSVKFLTEAAVSNGLNTFLSAPVFFTGSVDPIYNSNKLINFLTVPETFLDNTWKRISVSSWYDVPKDPRLFEEAPEDFVLRHGPCDPYGRGMTGFSPSGGSIFGKEYTLPVATGQEANNPWYISDEADRIASFQELSSTIAPWFAPYALSSPPYVKLNPGPPFKDAPGPPYYTNGTMATGFYLVDGGGLTSVSTPSPYLVRPGERLVLAMSKTRPATSSSNCRIPNSTAANTGSHILRVQNYWTGSSSGHDVTLATGSINITFYGSYVREGSTYSR